MFQRHRRFPMAITVRGDVPFYRLLRDHYANFAPTGPAYVYEVPISLIYSMGY